MSNIAKQTVSAVGANKWKRRFSQCCKIDISDPEKKKEHDITNICEILDFAYVGDLLNFFFTWKA
jgi:hypothetical protein